MIYGLWISGRRNIDITNRCKEVSLVIDGQILLSVSPANRDEVRADWQQLQVGCRHTNQQTEKHRVVNRVNISFAHSVNVRAGYASPSLVPRNQPNNKNNRRRRRHQQRQCKKKQQQQQQTTDQCPRIVPFVVWNCDGQKEKTKRKSDPFHRGTGKSMNRS